MRALRIRLGWYRYTVESGLRHPLPNLNRQGHVRAQITKLMLNTCHFQRPIHHILTFAQWPVNKVQSRHPSKLSRLNASLIEHRSFDNERGRG
jgi:hypothetical protein